MKCHAGWLFGSTLGTVTSASEAHAVRALDTPGEQDLPAETSIAAEVPHTIQPQGSAAVHADQDRPHADDGETLTPPISLQCCQPLITQQKRSHC